MPQVSHLLWDSGPHIRTATSGSSFPFNIARRYFHATMLSMLSWLAIFSVISTRGSISEIGSNSVFLSRVSTLERVYQLYHTILYLKRLVHQALPQYDGIAAH